MRADTGVERISRAFEAARAEDRAALIAYLALGHPTSEAALDCVEAAVAAGADLIELGVPFSDPLADGPVIQRATQIALRNGTTTAACLEAARTLRGRGIEAPLLFMGYTNPILSYGEDRFCADCLEASVDGMIVPDLPPEEGLSLTALARARGLGTVYLVAPPTPIDRMRFVASRSDPFLYVVTVTGITGPRERVDEGLLAVLARARVATDKPLAAGFGIATPAQASAVARWADGVIVGSALVRAAESGGAEQVGRLVGRLAAAMGRNGADPIDETSEEEG